MSSRGILTSFNLRETDLYYLVGKSLKACFGISANTLFFEVPIASSRADIVHVQATSPYESCLAAGLHVFEVKMRWDSDRARLARQLRDYSRAADYVWLVGVNCAPESRMETVGEAVFSTNGCGMDVMKPPRHSVTVDLEERQQVLRDLSGSLKAKHRLVEEMAWVNPCGERMLLIQEKLPF